MVMAGRRVLRQVRPLVGVGLGTMGTDGEGLPAAAMRALEAALRTRLKQSLLDDRPLQPCCTSASRGN
jgi:hypothetical protein